MSPYRYPETTGFPYLNYLLGAYFHQDFDINGNTLEEIIATSKKDFVAEDRAGTVADIRRFIATYGDTDSHLAEEFVKIFHPDIIAEGWDGLTTRQWLLRISELLEEK
jgi:hypothetical protein